jgi:hypothetical protein
MKEKEYIETLFSKAQALKSGECLWTTFGPLDSFRIIRKEKEEVFSFQRKGSYFTSPWTEAFPFNDALHLAFYLGISPHYTYYAKNEFSGKEDAHMDNIVNFCNAFKLRHKSETEK